MKDRVVCIRDDNRPHHDLPKVVKGEIYTIRGTCKVRGFVYYKFHEIPETEVHDMAYCAFMFRPVDDSFGEWVEETIMKEAVLEEILIEL